MKPPPNLDEKALKFENNKFIEWVWFFAELQVEIHFDDSITTEEQANNHLQLIHDPIKTIQMRQHRIDLKLYNKVLQEVVITNLSKIKNEEIPTAIPLSNVYNELDIEGQRAFTSLMMEYVIDKVHKGQ